MAFLAQTFHLPDSVIMKGLSFASDFPGKSSQPIREVVELFKYYSIKSILLHPNYTSTGLVWLFRPHIFFNVRNYTYDEIQIVEDKMQVDMIPFLKWTKLFHCAGARRFWYKIYSNFVRELRGPRVCL